MQYTIMGRLCRRPCDNFEEPLSNTTIRLYRTEDGQGLTAAATARPKDTFDLQSAEEVDDRGSELLTEAKTDDDGRYRITIDEDDYDGEVILVDALIHSTVTTNAEPVQATITALQPRWRKSEEGAIARWDYCLSRKQWCAILEALGLWVVCGRVTVCDRDVPIPNATVTVFDADIIEEDELGSDTTNANGWYRVYYTRADFERVPAPFSPIELRSGPDCYVHVTSSGGSTLLEESPSDGRQPGREDLGHCARIDVCAPIDIPDEDEPKIPTAWTSVGNAFMIPDSNSLNDFDADGYAGSLKFALTGSLRMTGSTPETTGAGNEVEYRFLAAPSTASNTDPAMNASQFTDAVGDQNNQTLFSSVEIGQLIRFGPGGLDILSVMGRLADVDDDGWLNLTDAIDRTFTENGVTDPAVRASYQWHDTDGLMGINTNELTTESNVPDSAADAGEDVPSGDRIDVEAFSFRFEAREVDSGGTATPLPANGQTLNRAVVNNNSVFQKMELLQQQGAECDPISLSSVDLGYTIYHPHLRDAEIQLKRNDQPTWNDLQDPETSLSVDSEVSFYSSTISGSQLKALQKSHYNTEFDISDEVTKECTYIVELQTRLRLHNGDSAASWSRLPPISFYAE